jgi:hypothetical protein
VENKGTRRVGGGGRMWKAQRCVQWKIREPGVLGVEKICGRPSGASSGELGNLACWRWGKICGRPAVRRVEN